MPAGGPWSPQTGRPKCRRQTLLGCTSSRSGQMPAAAMRCPPAAPLLGGGEGLRFWWTEDGLTDRRHHRDGRHGQVHFCYRDCSWLRNETSTPARHRHRTLGRQPPLRGEPLAQRLGSRPGAPWLHRMLTPSFRNNIKNNIFYFLPINERITVNQHFDSRPRGRWHRAAVEPPLPGAPAPMLVPWEGAPQTQTRVGPGQCQGGPGPWGPGQAGPRYTARQQQQREVAACCPGLTGLLV